MYNKEEKYIIWLTTFDFMSYKKAKLLIDNYESLEEVFCNLSNHKSELLKIFDESEYNELKNNNNFLYVDRLINNYEQLKIKIVTIRSNTYPELLQEISSPPILLYCKGDINLLNSECLGVVGSRRCTKYGTTVGAQIVKDVSSSNITIVSGLAEGIDTVAHKSCLEVNGKTIAVLGSGLLSIFPTSNINLANQIVEKGGLLVSEYKPNEPALNFHFPIRNRIIAGLSKAIFVVEANEKSGSMHTKNYALEYNREVFSLPARVNDIYSIGCNKIIQNGQARMVLSSSDILEFYDKFIDKFSKTKVLELTIDEQIIYDNLVGQELHFDDLLKITKLETKNLATLLMRMELKGIVEKIPGNYYMLKDLKLDN